MNISNKLLSDIVTYRTYARHMPNLMRRESLQEIINRNMMMHLDKFPKLSRDITKAFTLVHELKVMPSMRCLQFGGEAVIKNNLRSYNCSFLHIDDPRAFSEALFLLLSGTGVGYSVQKRHVMKLPTVTKPREEGIFFIHDSIQGWAQALYLLVEAYFYGSIRPNFNYANIRAKGEPLKTTGARAPGPEPLKTMLQDVEARLQRAIGRKLRPIEVHDIACIISDCVLAGGIRRSALISLFDKDDKEMLKCKSGDWYVQHPYRARANNSVVLHRAETTEEEFRTIFKACQESGSGEPGIFWTNDYDYGCNPCFAPETLVTTLTGTYQIRELVGKKVNIWNGKEWQQIDNFRVTAKNQKVLKITLQDGSSVRLTPYHTCILSNGERVEARNLRVNDKLMASMVENDGIEEEFGAYLKGFLVGDGTKVKDRAILSLYHTKYMCERRLIESAREIDSGPLNTNVREDLEFIQDGPERKSMKGLTPKKKELFPWVTDYKNGLPTKAFCWTRHTKAEFLAGLFDSDGTALDTKNGFGYQLSSISQSFLLDVQSLLKTLGIRSKVTQITEEGHKRDFYDGYGEYFCHALYRLTIGQAGAVKLAQIAKFERLMSFADRELKYKIKDRYNEIIDIREDGIEKEVYCCTVDESHSLSIGVGIHIGQCLEVSLNNGQLCNLTTINQTGIKDKKDFLRRVYNATLLGTLQAAYTDFPYLRPFWKETTEREALLGVSFTGIADSGGIVTEEWLQEGAKLALEVNEKYAKKLGINLAARTSVVKPEGCRPWYGLVTTDSGIYTLFDLFKDHEDGQAWSTFKDEVRATGNGNRITKTFNNGLSDIYEITLGCNVTVQSTPNHPWMVLEHYNNKTGNRTPINQFIEAKDIKEGDILDVKVGLYNKETHATLQQVNCFNLSMLECRTKITQPTQMSPSLAWVLGYLFADGCITSKNRVKFFEADLAIIDKLSKNLKTLFGTELRVEKVANKNMYECTTASVELVAFFHKNGIEKYSPSSQSLIPLCVRTSSREDIIAFFAGFLDGDGCVRKDEKSRDIDYQLCCLTQKQSLFTKHLQDIGLAVGLVFGRSVNAKRTGYSNLPINIMNLSSFTTLYAASTLKQHSVKLSSDPRPVINNSIAHAKRQLAKVTKINCLGKMRTYDIEIESDHWFFDGAVKSHNTASCVLGSSSGIHARHADYYIRRVQINKNDPLYYYLKDAIPELVEDYVMAPNTAVISIPQESPKGAVVRDAETAMDLFSRVMMYNKNWIAPGHRSGANKNNVSCSISLKEDEWSGVATAMWKNRAHYTGISLFPFDLGTHKQTPFETCTKETYEQMLSKMREVDFKDVKEINDNTSRNETVACAGGACEIT